MHFLQLCTLRSPKKVPTIKAEPNIMTKRKCICPDLSCHCGVKNVMPHSMYHTVNSNSYTATSWQSSNYNEHDVGGHQYSGSAELNVNYSSAGPSLLATAAETKPFSAEANNLPYTDAMGMPNNEFFEPEEIFMTDQPIRTAYSTDMSPASSSGRSPTLLDLESGTIQRNNGGYQQLTSNSAAIKSWTPIDIKYESCDDTSSLTSTSSQFDEAYYNFQQQTGTNTADAFYGELDTGYVQNQFFDHCESVAATGSGTYENSVPTDNSFGYYCGRDSSTADGYHTYGGSSLSYDSNAAATLGNQWNQQDANGLGTYASIPSTGNYHVLAGYNSSSASLSSLHHHSHHHQLSYATA